MKGTSNPSLRLISLAICAVAASAGCSASAFAQTTPRSAAPIHMPQGAFLHKPSPDVTHLVAQVRSDHAVAVRYARLFHLPVKMVPLAFEQLKLKQLSTDHIMQVHFVKVGKDNKEQLIYKPRRVKAGTPVYCLPDGTPLLVRVCGNPIRAKVSPEFYSSTPVPDFSAAETLIPRPSADSSTAFAGPTRLILPPVTPLPVIPVVEAENVLPPALLPVPPALAPSELKIASLPPVYSWAHGPSGLFGLAALPALLPLINAGGGGGGGAAALVPPIVVPPGNGGGGGVIVPGIVPEPGILLVGAAALLGSSLLYKRRRVKSDS